MELSKHNRAVKGDAGKDGAPSPWSRPWRAVVSAAIVFHLLALVAEPMRMFSQSSLRPGAPHTQSLRGLVAPYCEFLFLDHGYFFFAPNPGPNHLIEARIQGPSSRGVIVERIPDRSVHWPRLYYHRHFMLSEFYNGISVPSVPPPELQQDGQWMARWRSDLDRYQSVRASLIQHWEGKYPDSRVQLGRIRHLLPSSDEVLLEGKPITDPSLYVPLSEDATEALPPMPQGTSRP
jgi:hypothetical protein